MIALLLIPLALAFAFSGFFDDEIERIAEENGLDGFDPDEPSIYDNSEVTFGTNTPDTLTGTSGDDAIFALGQADVVRALGGDDLVEAGTNNDTVYGGPGDDLIGGGTGFDVLYGDDGDDALLGNGGDDLLIGRAGEDLLIGGGGADSLNGGPGDDLLVSGYVEIGDEGEQDVSASALAAVAAYTDGSLEDVDFAALEDAGALNGVDTSFLTQALEPSQGGDLRGGDGDDVLVLGGGDTASGGAGQDLFVLNEDMVDETTVVITDFSLVEDIIALEFEGPDEPDIQVLDRDEDAVIFIGAEVIARIEGAAGLTTANLRLVQASA
ncbi:MAG: calcium-binding protein [Planktotalea sp.]|uniref:calcium-binding protein n=1 Tax=Planktotalea sp. TaxID=2029877 RepID=UPI003C777E1F